MPELPEAETIKNALKKALVSLVIEKVEIFSPAMREPLTPLLSAPIAGKKIIDVRRRGRYVILELEESGAILMHFGMSGVVRIEGAEVPRRKHEHVFFHLSNHKIIRFECTRRFSLVKFCCLKAAGGEPEELKKLGVEPLTSAFNPEFLYQAAQKHKGAVKNFIMNNEIVVGIGNIYAAESLFAAGINPLRSASTLTKSECVKLTEAVKVILQKSIKAGGSTISDYRQVDGSEGHFAQELKIYGKSGEECPVCGSLFVTCKIGGRSSFYCPECQKL